LKDFLNTIHIHLVLQLQSGIAGLAIWTERGGKGKRIRYLYHDFVVLAFFGEDELEDYETWLGFSVGLCCEAQRSNGAWHNGSFSGLTLDWFMAACVFKLPMLYHSASMLRV
jgi:hypothetical protein